MKKKNSFSRNIYYLIAASRPYTLQISISSIITSSIYSYTITSLSVPHMIYGLLISIFMQIGANYANDYSDGIKGLDNYKVKEKSVVRLVGLNIFDPKIVKRLAFLFLTLASIFGLILIIEVKNIFLLILGIISVLSSWFYSGSKKYAYGYKGFGEIAAFIFFGPISVLGMFYIQVGNIKDIFILLQSIGLGLLSSTLLLVNNIRDFDNDKLMKKNTLVVLIGLKKSNILYMLSLYLVFFIDLTIFLIYKDLLIFNLILSFVFINYLAIVFIKKNINFNYIMKTLALFNLLRSLCLLTLLI